MVADFLYRKTLPRSVFSQVRVEISTQSYSNFGLRDGTHPLAVGPVNPGLCQDRADHTGSAGGCQELGPGRQAGSRTTSTASAGSQVRPGPRIRRYARTTAKPRKQGGVSDLLLHPPCRLGASEQCGM